MPRVTGLPLDATAEVSFTTLPAEIVVTAWPPELTVSEVAVAAGPCACSGTHKQAKQATVRIDRSLVIPVFEDVLLGRERFTACLMTYTPMASSLIEFESTFKEKVEVLKLYSFKLLYLYAKLVPDTGESNAQNNRFMHSVKLQIRVAVTSN